MRSLVLCLTFTLVGLTTGIASAQVPDDAHWIWLNASDPAAKDAPDKVWFRREVRASEPSTGAVRIAAANRFVLWVNGQRIAEGEGNRSYRFNLNGIVERGVNVIAVEATKAEGSAGLFVDGEVRSQRGVSIPFDSGTLWRATAKAPEGDAWLKPNFDESSWSRISDLGPHADSPWKDLQFAGTYLDRYELAPGFQIERVGEPDLVGSIVAITWGNRGRLIASRERGPILSVIDSDNDGRFDSVVEYSTEVTNCQGLCMVFDDLYAVGSGPNGTGIYRLPDADHDDKADSVELVMAYKEGMGEHGPHNVVFGPDGWLYHNSGNHAWVPHERQPNSPVLHYEEGYLLEPKFEDARGHAVGIKAPGGTIWRFTPDGKQWWLETNGFRNEYDIAFNSKGDLFSFDSDMEWDVGLPWYRPVRVNHCIPGAEFGWRSGAAKWPPYYFDSLPGTVDIGRGSPTGVVFYEHTAFPQKYQGSFLVCDWSMGRIMAVFMQRKGATYHGTWENLVAGNPLNVSDIEIDRDGSVIFSTGGRGTEGGIYRVTHNNQRRTVPAAETIADALRMPQLQAGWAREAVATIKQQHAETWEKELAAIAKSGKPEEQIRALTLLTQFGPKPSADLLIDVSEKSSPEVRQFVLLLLGTHKGPHVERELARRLSDENPTVKRRACEAYVRAGLEPPVDALLPLLGSTDRWLRYAARLTLERVPPEKWKAEVLGAKEPHVATHGLLALHRLGADELSHDAALRKEIELLSRPLSQSEELEVLRMIQLTLMSGAKGPLAERIGQILVNRFPTGDTARDSEIARILAALQVPEATEKILALLERTADHGHAVHYALVLRYLNAGWTPALKQRLFAWYDSTRDWEGGHSFAPYLANIVGASLDRDTPAERQQLLTQWKQYPFAATLLLSRTNPDEVQNFSGIVAGLFEELERQPGDAKLREMIDLTIQALGKSTSPASRETLRQLYETHADLRDPLTRSIAALPTEEDWPYLLRSLQFGEGPTLQVALQALRGIKKKPETAEPVRDVILAGLKLGDRGGLVAVALLEQWTGSPHKAGRDVRAALSHYQAWYREQYPEAPAPELAKAETDKTRYTYQQLFDFLENNPQGRDGDVERGRQVFAKANCIKCHRFLKEGEGVGPDLTTVRRRFQRKEIIESLLFPSRIISDQYRTVTIVTEDGLIHTGMPLPQQGKDDTVLLLLADATKIEIPRSKIEEQAKATISVMPEGLLKDLSLQEIADLFAFLETSKSNPEPTQAAAAGQ